MRKEVKQGHSEARSNCKKKGQIGGEKECHADEENDRDCVKNNLQQTPKNPNEKR